MEIGDVVTLFNSNLVELQEKKLMTTHNVRVFQTLHPLEKGKEYSKTREIKIYIFFMNNDFIKHNPQSVWKLKYSSSYE